MTGQYLRTEIKIGSNCVTSRSPGYAQNCIVVGSGAVAFAHHDYKRTVLMTKHEY